MSNKHTTDPLHSLIHSSRYAPSAAYRQVEFLLGRISSLGEVSDFTTQSGSFGNGLNFTTANVTTTNVTMKMF